MDDARFDRIARRLSACASRRRMVQVLAGALLGAAMAPLRRGDAAACQKAGKGCLRNRECCSGHCKFKRTNHGLEGSCAPCPLFEVPCGDVCLPPRSCCVDKDCAGGQVCVHGERPTDARHCACKPEHKDCGRDYCIPASGCCDDDACSGDDVLPQFCAPDGRCLVKPELSCPGSIACRVFQRGGARQAGAFTGDCEGAGAGTGLCVRAAKDAGFQAIALALNGRGYRTGGGRPTARKVLDTTGDEIYSLFATEFTLRGDASASAFLGYAAPQQGEAVAMAAIWRGKRLTEVLVIGETGRVVNVRSGQRARRAGVEAPARDPMCQSCRDICAGVEETGCKMSGLFAGMIPFAEGVIGIAASGIIDHYCQQGSSFGRCWSQCHQEGYCPTDGCPDGYTEDRGLCECQGTHMQECGTKCVNIQKDDANCGGCSTQVGGGGGSICTLDGKHCSNGVCCPTGQSFCRTGGSAKCTNTDTDKNHCGGCAGQGGQGCTGGKGCSGGKCQCTGGKVDCGGTCKKPGSVGCPCSDQRGCGGQATQTSVNCCRGVCTGICSNAACGNCSQKCTGKRSCSASGTGTGRCSCKTSK